MSTRVPTGDDQPITLHLAQCAVDGRRVRGPDAQPGLRQAIQEIIAVRWTLEEEQQKAGLQEILGLSSMTLAWRWAAISEHRYNCLIQVQR